MNTFNIEDIAMRVARDAYRQSVYMVDMTAKPVVLPPNLKKQAMKAVMSVVEPERYKTHYFDNIPIGEIIEALAKLGFIVIQEDGTEWSGFLTGRDGSANFLLSWEGRLIKNSALHLSWHKMEMSGRYEITAYIS